MKRMSALGRDVVLGICISLITNPDWEVCVVGVPFFPEKE